MLVLFWTLLTAASFIAGYALATVRHRRIESVEHAFPLHDVDDVPPESSRVRFERHRDAREEQRAMADVGERLRRAGVKLVVFAHGSFVGDDPLAIADALGDVRGLPGVAHALRRFTRNQVDRIVGDLSNFTREYVEAFARATGVEAIEFAWSGENHHAARVHGAVRLARAIALHGGGRLRGGDGILLLAHSHGGQLLALLSQLSARSNGYEDLVMAALARGEDAGALEEHLGLIRRLSVDAVTFGTPPRYGWARGARFRVLHVVNHRGTRAVGGTLRGLLHTRGGDYVHQLGVPGSDFPAATAADRALNARLARVLGEGTNVQTLIRNVARGMRVAPHGHTILVDYGDEARVIPNFIATGLGHAAYTRREAMSFHARILADHFYPSSGRLLLPSAGPKREETPALNAFEANAAKTK